MARTPGTLNMGNNFEMLTGAPADAREVTALKADLTDPAVYPWVYVGMEVYVEEENKKYRLKALPATVASNWEDLSAGFDPTYLEEELAKKAEGYIETNTETVTAGTDRPLVKGETVTIKTLDDTPVEYSGVVDENGIATIDADGVTVTVENVDPDGFTITPDVAGVIDDSEAVVTTETIHHIDSRIIPKGDKSETMDYLENALTVKEQQGKYEVGDVIPAETSLEEIIIKMLTKTNYPTLTPPSASLSGTGEKLLESGSTANVTLTATFNRGAIDPAYGTSGYRAGEATAYSLNGGGEQVENTFTETVTELNKEFTATVNYGAGDQPKDDEGNDYMEALGAGSVTTNMVKYEFVDALYSNAANNSVIAKEALVSKSAGQKVFVFAPQTATSPEVFDVPSSFTVVAVEVLNDLSGKWEDDAKEFDITDVTHPNAAGTDVAYKRYTDNRGYPAGSRSIRVRWTA